MQLSIQIKKHRKCLSTIFSNINGVRDNEKESVLEEEQLQQEKASFFFRQRAGQEQQETKCRNEEDLALMCGQKIRMVEAAPRSRLLLSIHQITAHLRRQPRPHCLSHLKQLIQRVQISDCAKLANAF